jgi:hypothetical protein
MASSEIEPAEPAESVIGSTNESAFRAFYERRYGSRMHRFFSKFFLLKPTERLEGAILFADMGIGLKIIYEMLNGDSSDFDSEESLECLKSLNPERLDERGILCMLGNVARGQIAPCYGFGFLMRACENSSYLVSWTSRTFRIDYEVYDAVVLLLTCSLDACVGLSAGPGRLEETWRASKDLVAKLIRNNPKSPFMFRTLRSISRLGLSVSDHDQPTWAEVKDDGLSKTGEAFDFVMYTMNISHAYDVMFKKDCSDLLHRTAFGRGLLDVPDIDAHAVSGSTFNLGPADALADHMQKYCLAKDTSSSPSSPLQMFDYVFSIESKWCQAITADSDRVIERIFRSTDKTFWDQRAYFMIRGLLVYFNKNDDLNHIEILPGLLACLAHLKLVSPLLAIAGQRATRTVYARILMRVKIDMYLLYVQRKLENYEMLHETFDERRRTEFRKGLTQVVKLTEVQFILGAKERAKSLLREIK